jgi:hypothetical protein
MAQFTWMWSGQQGVFPGETPLMQPLGQLISSEVSRSQSPVPHISTPKSDARRVTRTSFKLRGHSHSESPAGFDGTLQASESSAF